MEDKQLRPLSRVSDGETVSLARINAGKGLRSRLIAMGLVRGVKITVVNNSHPGPFVISVRDSKMMLGTGMASKILVV